MTLQIHCEINPFKAYVAQQFLFDMDPAYYGSYIPAQVFALSSYQGLALSSQAILEDGSLWSDLPLHALSAQPEQSKPALALEDLVYKNCPHGSIVVNEFAQLRGSTHCYFPRKNMWLAGEYMATIDWCDDNEQFHLISLQNGQYAALPNHKIKFGSSEKNFKKYRKSHQVWRV